MIFFFGTRPGKTELYPLKGIPCPHCAQTNTLTVVQSSNWFHFFWIKIFRISNHVMAECSHCKRVYYKAEFTDSMRAALERP